MFNRKSKAFTLIELLVVIAIISLLVSILLPSLSRAKELAKRVVCASNMKSIGLALNLYAHDWDEYFPPMEYDPANGSNQSTIHKLATQEAVGFGLLYPDYISTPRTYYCPSDTHFTYERASWPVNSNYMYFGNTIWYGDAKPPPRDDWGTRCGTMSDPGRTVAGDYGYYWDIVWSHENAGSNILYVDSHVDWWSDDQLYSVIGRLYASDDKHWTDMATSCYNQTDD